jgi:hypothetical protein
MFHLLTQPTAEATPLTSQEQSIQPLITELNDQDLMQVNGGRDGGHDDDGGHRRHRHHHHHRHHHDDDDDY